MQKIYRNRRKIGWTGKPARRQMMLATQRCGEAGKVKCTVCCPTPEPQPT